ncbi:hypothetical protein BZG25_03335 [Salinivibrio sp. ML198]|uniref:ATP-binding protein n=1 Tax=unclassified Salinivibrio TaxID=2636825 RepID=UPI000984B158|nr:MULTISPECIES: DUF3404 domain-containing protein [unclassified Salinivibrio]OOE67162.1 hypothetical protein BZG20_06865 [Salinivibrio sp. IB868]OOE77287.1 hypothetical protein BZG22_02180 [Salinivibrio sp. IB870]OOE81655.1 hypothetical protein BZG25_03335 [Salinivibrio sp. ML198]
MVHKGGKVVFRALAALLLALLSSQTVASELHTQLKGFYDKAWQTGTLMVAQPALNAYPQALLVSQSQYPDFENVNWQDLNALHQVVQTCQPTPSIVSPLLLAAQRFELALCRDEPIPIEWFEQNPLLHPAGGSYAERYVSARGIATPSPELVQRFTLANEEHPLHAALNVLSQAGRDALLSGYRAYLDGGRLWLNGEEGWKALSHEQWAPIAEQYRLSLSTNTTGCDYRYGNICNQLHPAYRGVMIAVFVAVFCALIVGLARSLYDRYQQRRERQFILQLLTHELRTPIASLGMTVEMLRSQFDLLEPSTQDVLWRLLADHQRLSQLTETSKGYLSTDKREQFKSQTASLSEWLDNVCDCLEVDYTLEQDKTLTLPFYWLSICLKNLIQNAHHHGGDQIWIRVCVDKRVRVCVYDNGIFPSWWQRLWRRYKSSPSERNMGIGLFLVARLMRQMGGKLVIKRHPTCCILELPQ